MGKEQFDLVAENLQMAFTLDVYSAVWRAKFSIRVNLDHFRLPRAILLMEAPFLLHFPHNLKQISEASLVCPFSFSLSPSLFLLSFLHHLPFRGAATSEALS